MGFKQPSKEQLEKMRAAGMGTQSIGKALDMTVSTVRYYLKKYGMPTALQVEFIEQTKVDAAIESWERKRQSVRAWRQQ